MIYSYRTAGTCSREIILDLGEDGVIREVRIIGGCSGNSKGLQALVRGRSANEVRELLRGIRCEDKPTSCPDQLARALDRALAEGEKKEI